MPLQREQMEPCRVIGTHWPGVESTFGTLFAGRQCVSWLAFLASSDAFGAPLAIYKPGAWYFTKLGSALQTQVVRR